ncbi:discoidin domain-containing protein [Alistipes senegalensis]|uniref:discoidin domain-containing protein n=1 Tax=Alistipes senegalensis TaxID=1288121 RepID=UPI0018AA0C71|nr:discoidin domain-containing protein [Alistipes senegalensis]
MRNIKLYGAICIIISLTFLSCGEARTEFPNVDGYTSIHLVGGSSMPIAIALPINETNAEYKFLMAYGGFDTFGRIEARLAADLSLVDAYNEANYTSYKKLPEECFSLPDEDLLVIPDGEKTSNLISLKVSPAGKLPLFETYMLPVTITDVKGNLPVNDALKTRYYTFYIELAEIDRTGWSIHSYSSQAENGEGGDLGAWAKNVLDGNINSYWHTEYTPNPSQPPHWIIVDMGKSTTISGFTMTPRQNSSNNDAIPVNGYYEVSDDAQTWERVYDFSNLPNTIERQIFQLDKPTDARYFRITVTTPRNQYYCNIAELTAF